jgi:hypothetical protein
MVRNAGAWIGSRAIDSREHVRIDGAFTVQEELEISHRSHQFGLGKAFDEVMKLVFVRHTNLILSLRNFLSLAWGGKASPRKTSTNGR